MGRSIFGWDLPPGCSVSDIPGNRPEDEAYEKLMDDFYAILSKEEEENAELLVDIIAKAIEYGINIGYKQAESDGEENKFYEEQARVYRKEHPVEKQIKIPDIKCACGTVIKVKRGVMRVNCRCGRAYRLFLDGKAILIVGGEQ